MAANQEDFVRIGLRATTSSDDIPTLCAICLDELQSGQEVDEIRRCGHTFHKHCLLAWLNSWNTQHSSCPNCRLPLFPSRHPLPPPPSDVDEQGDLAGVFTSLDELSNTVSMLGDTVVAFRNHNNLLLSELRRHNLDVPDASPSDPRFRRALEAVHELKPVPSCIMPDPATGEYTPIEERYRRLKILETDRISGVALEDRWRNRSAFVRDLERLEQLRLHLGPQPASDNRPEPGLDQTRLLIEYGALLNKLMPDNWHFTPDETGAMRSEWLRGAVIGSFDRELLQETRLFSLLSIATEGTPGKRLRVFRNEQ